MLLNCGVGEDSCESLGLQGDPTSPSWSRSVLGVHWKDWCWSWSSNTLATWCKELTHLKRPWCWERLRAGGEGNNKGWDGWMASLTQWTWVWVDSGVADAQGGLACSRPWGRKERHNWATELNWTKRNPDSLEKKLGPRLWQQKYNLEHPRTSFYTTSWSSTQNLRTYQLKNSLSSSIQFPDSKGLTIDAFWKRLFFSIFFFF